MGDIVNFYITCYNERTLQKYPICIPCRKTRVSKIQKGGIILSLPRGTCTFDFLYPLDLNEPFVHLVVSKADQLCEKKNIRAVLSLEEQYKDGYRYKSVW